MYVISRIHQKSSIVAHEGEPNVCCGRDASHPAPPAQVGSRTGAIAPQVQPTHSIIYARTAPPVNVVTGKDPFGGYLSGASSVQRPNLVSGVPLWIANPNAAGGMEINPAAFTIPAGAVQGDLGRNALRGFGATQVDLTLRRQATKR